MRKILLAIVICGCTAGVVANAAVARDRAVYSALQQTADAKKVCTTKWITEWVTKWVTTAKGKVQQRVQVRTPTAVCAVRG
jgi:hypothetical protein